MNPEQNKKWNQLCHIKERAKADAARYGLWADLSKKRYEKVDKEIQELKASTLKHSVRTPINSKEKRRSE